VGSRLIGTALLVLLAGGCSHGQTEPDAGEDGIDASDAFDAGDDGSVGGDDGGIPGDDGGTSGDPVTDRAEDGGDGSSNPYWAWCPEASEYIGGEWPVFVEVTENAVYCGTFYEMRELEEEYRVKSKLRWIPGRYALPVQNGTYPFFLPHCFEFIQPDAQPVAEGAGEIVANHSPDAGGTTYRWFITQALRTASGEEWEFRADLHTWIPTGEDTFTLNGDSEDAQSVSYQSFMLCRQDCQSWIDNRWYASCRFETAALQKHTVTFAGGRVELYVRMGVSMASTEPALFVRSLGTLDTVDFEQQDYYRLIYNPEHHHFSRDFIVLFDQPISSACGLKVLNLDPWNDDPPGRAALVGCDLTEIEERQVSEELFEIIR
jgi:hypothetical protein